MIVSTGIFCFTCDSKVLAVDVERKTVGDWQYAVTLTTPGDSGRLTLRFFIGPRFATRWSISPV